MPSDGPPRRLKGASTFSREQACEALSLQRRSPPDAPLFPCRDCVAGAADQDSIPEPPRAPLHTGDIETGGPTRSLRADQDCLTGGLRPVFIGLLVYMLLFFLLLLPWLAATRLAKKDLDECRENPGVDLENCLSAFCYFCFLRRRLRNSPLAFTNGRQRKMTGLVWLLPPD